MLLLTDFKVAVHFYSIFKQKRLHRPHPEFILDSSQRPLTMQWTRVPHSVVLSK